MPARGGPQLSLETSPIRPGSDDGGAAQRAAAGCDGVDRDDAGNIRRCGADVAGALQRSDDRRRGGGGRAAAQGGEQLRCRAGGDEPAGGEGVGERIAHGGRRAVRHEKRDVLRADRGGPVQVHALRGREGGGALARGDGCQGFDRERGGGTRHSIRDASAGRVCAVARDGDAQRHVRNGHHVRVCRRRGRASNRRRRQADGGDGLCARRGRATDGIRSGFGRPSADGRQRCDLIFE
mmetsp:Transcript_8399/g.26204  ORF Transcript_8399/g.26204 Transcript_8399/m.26204 type:complete len:237 (-) Transcript_8399:261-971(-)